MIAQDSTNINAGIEHDYVTNKLKRGNESHSIATLLQMFHVLAQKVKDAQCKENTLQEQDEEVHQNSILDNHPLAVDHLIFKFSSIDPHAKCLELWCQ